MDDGEEGLEYVLPLKEAVPEDGTRLAVQALASVNVKDLHANAVLHRAAAFGNADRIRQHIEAGADLNSEAFYTIKGLYRKVTPLHCAAGCDAECTRLLLEHGAQVGAVSSDKTTPLYWALRFGQVECVRLLVAAGANIEFRFGVSKYSKAETPMHLAVNFGHVECAKLLVEKGASVNIRDSKNVTPLHVAAKKRNTECLKFLLDNGADVNSRDIHAVTPLHITAASAAECMKLLIQRSACVNARNNEARTPLHEAAATGNLEAVELLISAGADVNCVDTFGLTPLHKAARSKASALDCGRSLLSAGALVNARDNHQATPLHHVLESSFSHGHLRLEWATLLLEFGANVDVADEYGYLPVALSVRLIKPDLLNLFLEWNCDVHPRIVSIDFQPLCVALCYHKLDVADMLLEAGPRSTMLTDILSHLEFIVGTQMEGVRMSHEDMLSWILEKKCTLQSLYHMCRNVVRYALRNSPHPLKKSVQGLHVPVSVQKDIVHISPYA